MRLQTLLEESEVAADILAAVREVIARKACTRELGTGRFPPVLRKFVVAELTAPDLAGSGERRHDLECSPAIAAETFRTAVQ